VDEIISHQVITQNLNLNDNPILSTTQNNTNINNNNISHIYSNSKYSNQNNNKKKSINLPNQNYSNIALNNQINQEQLNQRGNLISNRKASSNYAKNIHQNTNLNQNNYFNLHNPNNNHAINLNLNINNNSPKYNSVSYIINNDLSKSNISNNFFEFQISNFSEIFNKLIKENIFNNTSNNYINYNFNSNADNNMLSSNTINNINKHQNQTNDNKNSNNNNHLNTNNSNITQLSNKNISNNYTNSNTKKRHTLNINTPNSLLNNNLNQNNQIQNNINLNSNNINNLITFDLQNFFFENNLNYQNFVDFLININCRNFKDQPKEKDLNKTKYLICLAKCNKTHNISRWPITNYEIIISPKKYFFIIEGEENTINNFFQDYKFINEKLNKTVEDSFSIYNQFVKNKMKYELNKILEEQNLKFRNEENLIISNNNNLNLEIESEKKKKIKSNEKIIDGKLIHKKFIQNTLEIRKNENMQLNFNSNPDFFENNLNIYKNNNNTYKNYNNIQYFYINNFGSEENENSYIIKSYFVSRILPEGIQRGILLIDSNEIIRFKPIINNYKNKTMELKISKIEAILKYRYLYRYKAINIFLFQAQRSKIFDFETEEELGEFYGFLTKTCKNLDRTFDDIEHHTNLWKFGSLSNFDYLMYLNTMASRSFSDLSQYPIFPWIISNYEEIEELDLTDIKNFRDLSKPIGALSKYKLERFLQNFVDMKKNSPKEQPFLYSEHYSNPSHIIYYLVRAHPLYQMKYKNGSLGPPERLFNSIRDCWNFILNINNEVKEVVPEFYSGCGDFLVNVFGLNFGETSNGKNVDNVVLPKWAKSPSHFISVCKSALESKYVSSNLHHWIDLIFGYKQKNESAVAAYNLFYPMTYENSIDKFCDKNFNFENELKKQAFNTQLSEYGQIPKNLFEKPHPGKKPFSIYSANYFLNNWVNSEEEIGIKMEYLIKENKRLEEECIRLEKEKMEEKENLILSQEEIEFKRKEKIRILKK